MSGKTVGSGPFHRRPAPRRGSSVRLSDPKPRPFKRLTFRAKAQGLKLMSYTVVLQLL